MQLTPRYHDAPAIVLEGDPGAVATPAIRQRRRLAATLAELTEEQWSHPSRCEGWSARDVVVHLDSTNSFWAFSIAQGLKGEPTQFLVTFDPVVSPAELVAGAGDLSGAEVLERFVASTEALCALVESLEGEAWTMLAEAPPGHISISGVVHHALWDCWVHERDVLLPLGVDPVAESDEVVASLTYAAALSPAFAIAADPTRRGTMTVTVTDPDLSLLVEIDDRVVVGAVDGADADPGLHLSGDATALLEALSHRRPIGQPVPADAAWILNGLAEIFDQPPG